VHERTVDNRCSIILFSGDLDKAMASFVLATGAAAGGLDVSMFFTFWGLSVLKKAGAPAGKKNVKEQMFSMMTPSSSLGLGTSKMNFFGMGSWMLRSMMKHKEIASLEDLMAIARDFGVKMMAHHVDGRHGLEKDELVTGSSTAASQPMADATQSRALFI
jgi:peroxiredoxin family protein